MELTRADVFQQHRGLVFTIAYDITGSVADAEDVTQETYLRWQSADAEVADGRAYLATIAANQARNFLRTSARRREDYIGPWLPEPLITGASRDDAPDDPERIALQADAVSTALLVMLQRLSDDERIGFLLKEVFDFPYPMIAAVLRRSEPATRQLVHRARGRVQNRPPRNEVSAAEHRRVVDQFLRAASTGDVETLLGTLAPDVVLVSDGGGNATSALRPVVGAEKTARFVLGLAEKHGSTSVAVPTELNGLDAVLFAEHAAITTTFQFDVADGLLQAIYVVRNPVKLRHLQAPPREG
ncbi:RNA polymerase sigma-70 factor (ECF subfamily) [Curtobacterium sp. PhB130]|uniref:RNA polymerase sigma factor SigJ n=1 Tax=Curtobacterium sp. PhB130 TaxID=2485178 RepID=UPI000F94A462|nr:RNA polymerase sigma factor SigJ [Curtobacterium sp. PhB130]ROS71926.1 RNA polymerase sigma-70 factor (ECF subfamily) [Curtobacterium sp. PhB130]